MTTPMNPDCRDGKHAACRGDAWDLGTDQPAPCACTCHQKEKTMTETTEPKPERRTKRRYAHELYPHAEDGETRALAEEVPYLYARAQGLEIHGTGWFDVEPRQIAVDRTEHLIQARHLALLADALLQGMVGEQAWQWATDRAQEESGEWIAERADVYGVDWATIKPYPCGPEPERHEHLTPTGRAGNYRVKLVDGRESECEECTEPVPAEGSVHPVMQALLDVHKASAMGAEA